MLASQFTYRCSCFHCMRLPLQISYIPFDATFSSGIQPLGCRQRKEKNNSFFLLGKNGDMACVLLGACDSLAALRLELQAQDMYIMRQWKFVEPASRPAHSRSFLHFVAFCLFSDSLNYGWVCGCVFVPAGRPTSRMYSAIREFHRMQAKHILTSCQARPFCPLFRTMDLTFYIYVCMCIEQRVEPTTLSIITEMAVVTWSNAFGWSVVWKLNCTTHAMHVSYLIQKATSSSECVCGGGVGGEGYGARQSTSVAAVCSFRMCIVARSMNTRKHFNEYILYV